MDWKYATPLATATPERFGENGVSNRQISRDPSAATALTIPRFGGAPARTPGQSEPLVYTTPLAYALSANSPPTVPLGASWIGERTSSPVAASRTWKNPLFWPALTTVRPLIL